MKRRYVGRGKGFGEDVEHIDDWKNGGERGETAREGLRHSEADTARGERKMRGAKHPVSAMASKSGLQVGPPNRAAKSDR